MAKLHPIESAAATYYASLTAQTSDPEVSMTHTMQRFGFTESEVRRFVRQAGLSVELADDGFGGGMSDLHDPQMGELV